MVRRLLRAPATRALMLTLVVGLGVAACTPSPAPAPTPAPTRGVSTATFESQVLTHLNQERARHGLAPVVNHPALASLARDWSCHMAKTGRFEHRDLLPAVIARPELHVFVSIGENIWSGTEPYGAAQAHQDWMNSTGHRQNMLNPYWTYVGIGVCYAADGEAFATQNFGAV